MTNPGMVEVEREYLYALETLVRANVADVDASDRKDAQEVVYNHDRVSALEYSDMEYTNEQ